MQSETDAGVSDSEGLLSSLVCVATNEVLEEELGVSEVAGVVLERLSVTSHESLLEIGSVPDPLLHLIASKEVFALFNELISAELDILVEKVTSKHLLAILVVDEIADNEQRSESGLGDESHILVMEHDVVVVEEHERSDRSEHHVLLVVGVLNVQVGHIIIPFGVVRVQEHSLKRELRSNTLGNIKEIEHLLDRLVTLLAHTSVRGNSVSWNMR